ncbi:MAG TPA: NAD(P)H-quinone oxidoreductase subunit O [Prochlorococcaceae cyanobacterium AMR_MDS_5431]|nr:NAD(P)H-quinone oxidoreductase subunit O [Prochlorococcaceae cyanobacterium AMR_MDS_5431]
MQSSTNFELQDLVKVNKQAYLGSLESRASDPFPPSYIFEGPATVLAIAGEYCLLRWRAIPAPDVWLSMKQLEYYS